MLTADDKIEFIPLQLFASKYHTMKFLFTAESTIEARFYLLKPKPKDILWSFFSARVQSIESNS